MKDILSKINENKGRYEIYIKSSNGKFTISSTDNLVNKKEFDSFDDAIKTIWRKDSHINITIIGGGHQALKEYLKNNANTQ